MSKPRNPFEPVRFNGDGMLKSQMLHEGFKQMWNLLEKCCTGSAGGRELALAKTNLQQSSMWAQSALAESKENREE